MTSYLSGEELRARYGVGEILPDDVPGRVFVFGHGSQEAAEAFAASNTRLHGCPSRAESRDGRWVTVTDVRPAILRVEQAIKESEQHV